MLICADMPRDYSLDLATNKQCDRIQHVSLVVWKSWHSVRWRRKERFSKEKKKSFAVEPYLAGTTKGLV